MDCITTGVFRELAGRNPRTAIRSAVEDDFVTIRIGQRLRVELGERDINCACDVAVCKFLCRPHIDQMNRARFQFPGKRRCVQGQNLPGN